MSQRHFLSLFKNRGSSVILKTRRCKSSSSPSHSAYCVNVVRKFDYENYLSSLLLPKEARSAGFAIRAFNVEVSQIQDTVSEAQIGLMRIQFWKDTLDAVFQNSPPESPVAIELAKAHQKHKLTKQWFSHMLAARESRLQNKSSTNLTQVEDYAEKCFSSPLFLLLETLGIRNVHADHSASHVGKAIGVVTLLRSVPYYAQRGQVHLPSTYLMKHGVSEEDVLRRSEQQNIKDLVYDIASTANNHMKLARSSAESLPKNTHLAFLAKVGSESYLKSLQIADFNVFDARLQQRNHWLPMTMWLQKFKRKI